MIKARHSLIHIKLSRDNLKNYERMLSNLENELNYSFSINKRVFFGGGGEFAKQTEDQRVGSFFYSIMKHMVYIYCLNKV